LSLLQLSTAITQVIKDMPIHKQLRKRAADRSEDAMSEDEDGVQQPNAPLQELQQQPSEATSVVSEDYSDRGNRKPAHQIGTKVKKVRAFFG
jgi:hypothetical protein